MHISVINPVHQTLLFGAVLGIIFLVTLWKKKDYSPLSLTQELKGFAILTIIFAHIGYVLSNQPEFLFPLSVLAGTGVNIFLFFSGYGLTMSTANKAEGPMAFYTKRLPRLFIPFWVVLAMLFLLDSFFLEGSYSLRYVIQSVFGIFTSANMYQDVNSPLWYFTFILFYYLLFPLVFFKRHIWLTAGILYVAVSALVAVKIPYLSGVIGFYEVHMLAFPLGVLGAWYMRTTSTPLPTLKTFYLKYEQFFYPIFLFVLCSAVIYLGLNGNVNKAPWIADITSIATMFVLILLFALKKRESKLLAVFGFYSYEIYLFHWPLLWRYDVIYTHLPAWLTTLVYLGIFIILARLLKRVVAAI